MITLQCKLKPEDYIKAQYLHMRPSPWLKYLSIALLSLWLVVLVTVTFSSGSLTNALRFVIPILLPTLFFCLIYGLILFVTIPWQTRRIFSQQKTLQMEYETVISPETIETTSQHGNTKINLSDFHKYKVGKDLILLYQSQVLFQMFPRHFFASEEDFKTFLSYLEANLGSPKR
jgi:YcxB-like protein